MDNAGKLHPDNEMQQHFYLMAWSKCWDNTKKNLAQLTLLKYRN